VTLLTKALRFSVIALFGATLSLHAAEKTFQTVEITILTVGASKEGSDFDGRLAPLERQLKSLNYRS
jgi:hypothetical protein